MKKYLYFMGIDVSKSTLDLSVVDYQGIAVHQSKISNTKQGLKELLKELKKRSNTLICFEDTGVYSVPLSLILTSSKMDYWRVPAIEIKRSKGISRGKTDRTDAKDIALYSLRNLDKLKLTKLDEKEVQQIKLLQTERGKVVKAIKLFQTTLENQSFLSKDIFKEVESCNNKVLQQLNKSLNELEARIQKIINDTPELKRQFNLLRSVPGIGKITAINMIVTTNGFENFKNWRKFACYSGIAPFEYSSGSSVRGRTKVNHFADKNMKSLLHMACLSAIKSDPELKAYYERKKQEGKHILLIMNNIKCKITSRAFAVIQRGTPFVNTQKFAA